MAKDKLSYKKFMPFFILLLVLVGGVIAITSVNVPSVTSDGSISKVGIVHVAVQRGEGSLYGEGYEDLGYFKNIVVDEGLNATRDILGQGSSFGAFDVIALANGTAAVATDVNADTEWTANGLSRVAGTYTTLAGSAGNWTISTTFTSTTLATLNVNKTCLVNQTTVAGDTLFACVNFNQVTLDGTAGDTLFVNWSNQITSG